MKYHKCPRCGLNYITEEQEYCKVCNDELCGKKSIFDDDFDQLLCPYCESNPIEIDELMCSACAERRRRHK